MKVQQIEAMLDKIPNIHDKLSETIHSISQSHFRTTLQNTINNSHYQNNFVFNNHFQPLNGQTDRNNCDFIKIHGPVHGHADRNNCEFVKDFRPVNGKVDRDYCEAVNGRVDRNGYVFVKEYVKADVEDDVDSVVKEAKSLDSIRTALENVEEQLELLHTVQNQQRAKQDAAIARLEQSRLVLAMRLDGHHGKKYQVIEEAQAFVADVHEASRFVCPEELYAPQFGEYTDNFISDETKNPNVLNLLWSKVKLIQKTLKLDRVGGIIGNSALVALSMLVLMHIQTRGQKDDYSLNRLHQQEDFLRRKVYRPDNTSSQDYSTQLDVLLARG
ncbi:hypothetical protein LIER_43729 [Lithospermum erythrorhizon]|uniref:Plastid division protein PDV1 n=1 Tax=Lithospermum erythrorhizon TaxID=34254 RepID=A0AAV3QQC1_LITER